MIGIDLGTTNSCVAVMEGKVNVNLVLILMFSHVNCVLNLKAFYAPICFLCYNVES